MGAKPPPKKPGLNQSTKPAHAPGAAAAQAPAPTKAPTTIEEAVLSAPSFAEAKAPELFRTFLDRLVPRIIFPDTTRGILLAFSKTDVTSEKVARCLKANPYYEHQFLQVIRSMGRREELPSVESAVVLLGMQNSRNLIVALQLLRTVRGTHPAWTKEGKLQVQPRDVLKFALRTEETVAGLKTSNAEAAFAAGAIFDMLAHAAEELAIDKQKTLNYIELIYANSLKCALVGIELAKQLPDFAYKKYIFPACLLRDTGKIVMMMLSPDYPAFLDALSKKDQIPRVMRHYAEGIRFGFNHSLLSSLICRFSRFFRPLEQSVYAHHEPYLLKNRNRNHYQLASLIGLSAGIANHFKKTEKLDDPILALWKGPELQDFRIDARNILIAVNKVI